MPLVALFTAGFLLFFASPSPSLADVRVVTATGQHRMTDRETRVDAIRLATEQAKQQALEQVASYLESVTVVQNLDVTQDELRSYTAGMVLVLDQQVDTALDGDVVVIRVTLKAQVDSEEAAQAILAMKQNEDVRQELLALKEDVESLHKQLEDANQALAHANSPEQVRKLNQQRTDLLNHAESDAMVAQAWTDWLLIAPFAHPYPSAGVAQVQALLGIAGRLNPTNPHLAIAQQTVGAKLPRHPLTLDSHPCRIPCHFCRGTMSCRRNRLPQAHLHPLIPSSSQASTNSIRCCPIHPGNRHNPATVRRLSRLIPDPAPHRPSRTAT